MPAVLVALDKLCVRKIDTVDPRKLGDAHFTYVDIGSIDADAKRIVSARQLPGLEAPSRARRLIRNNDIIVSMTRPNLNAVAIVDSKLDGQVCSTGFCVLRSGPNLLPSYLFHFVKSKGFVDALSSLTSGALYPAVTEAQVRSQLIPLPPLSEQQRIVDILDRAASIQRLRKAADDKLREIIPALFVDMFGDPASNPKGWPVKRFGEVGQLDRGRSRHRPRDAAELYGGPYPFIQTGEVANSGGYITRYSKTYSEAGLAQSRLWKSGTLCITIAANIANTGILQFDACFPDSVVGFTPDDSISTEYVRGWLNFLQPTIAANAPQAAQKNINLEILRELPMPIPPKQVIIEYDKACHTLQAVSEQSTRSLGLALQELQSLANTAFAL